jgi:hypothetical protein
MTAEEDADDEPEFGDDTTPDAPDSTSRNSAEEPTEDRFDRTTDSTTAPEEEPKRPDESRPDLVDADEQPVGASDEDDGPSLAGILGAEQPEEEEADGYPRPTIEPETPSLENAVFVVIGVVGSLLVVYRLVTLF